MLTSTFQPTLPMPREFVDNYGNVWESAISDAEAYAECARYRDMDAFLSSFLRTPLSRMSEKQIRVLHVNVLRRAGKTPIRRADGTSTSPVRETCALDLSSVPALFQDKMSLRLKKPRIFLFSEQFGSIMLCPIRQGAQSRYPVGSVRVYGVHGDAERGDYYGTITPEGRFSAYGSIGNSPDLRAILTELANNPHDLIKAHGRKRGRCGYCNRRLKDDRSLAAGCGSDCAEQRGIAWG